MKDVRYLLRCALSSGRAYSHLPRYSLATTTNWYLSSVLGMYEISIPTDCHGRLMGRPFRVSSYHRGALFSHCLHIFTQSLTVTYSSSHLYCSTTFHNIPSLPWRPLSWCAASIGFIFCCVLTNSFAGCLLVSRLQLNTPSATRYCVASPRNRCIPVRVFPSSCLRFTRISPISFCLSLCFSTTLNPTNGPYPLSPLFRSGPHSSPVPLKLAWFVSSETSSTIGTGSASPCGHSERPLGPPLSLPGAYFTSKSNSRIHAFQWVTTAPGRLLAGKFSWCTKLLASVSMRNQTLYMSLWNFLSVFITPQHSHLPTSYLSQHWSRAYFDSDTGASPYFRLPAARLPPTALSLCQLAQLFSQHHR